MPLSFAYVMQAPQMLQGATNTFVIADKAYDSDAIIALPRFLTAGRRTLMS